MKKLINVAAVLIIIAVVAFVGNTVVRDFGLVEKEYPVELVYEKDAQNRYYYTTLSENGKKAYTLVLPKIYEHEKQIEIPKLSDSEFNELLYALSYDNPDLICFSGDCKLKRSNGLYYFVPGYTHTLEQHDKLMAQLDSAVNGIMKNINRYSGSYAKELYLHDCLCEVCTYDTVSKDDGLTVSSYDALVNGKAVCEGYSKAFKLLLDKAGIKNYVVIGNARDNSGYVDGHMWNVVTIDYKNYYVDSTWDDMAGEKNMLGVTHFYFNVNDELLSADHFDIEPSQNSCYSLEKNYFAVNDCLYENYGSIEETKLAKSFAKAVKGGNNYCEMFFTNQQSYENARKKLEGEGKITEVVNTARRIDSSFRYSSVEVFAADELHYIRFSFK